MPNDAALQEALIQAISTLTLLVEKTERIVMDAKGLALACEFWHSEATRWRKLYELAKTKQHSEMDDGI